MEAFSDGVFAIAITLLILDIVVHPPGTLLEQVVHAGPSYLAYIISFLTIGAAWIGHTALTERLSRIDSIFLRLNLLVLLVVVFLPFPTRLVSESLVSVNDERVAVTIYGLTLLAIRVFGFLLDSYARREHLYKSKGESSELERDQRSFLPTLAVYTVAIAIGLIFPRFGVLIYFGVAVYLVLPLREITRLFFSRT